MEVQVYENEAFESSERDFETGKEPKPTGKGGSNKSSNESYDFSVIMAEVGDLKIYQLFLVLLVTWITIPDGLFVY